MLGRVFELGVESIGMTTIALVGGMLPSALAALARARVPAKLPRLADEGEAPPRWAAE
jgi:hypothetical protein